MRIRSATALRCSSLIVRFWLPAALAAFFLPRPTAGGTFPSIASIALYGNELALERALLVS